MQILYLSKKHVSFPGTSFQMKHLSEFVCVELDMAQVAREMKVAKSIISRLKKKLDNFGIMRALKIGIG